MSDQNCPLCQQPNLCTADSTCWCFNTSIPDVLIQTVPDSAKNKQCICADCVSKANLASNVAPSSSQE